MTAYIEVVGAAVMRRHDLDDDELRSIGKFTRENVLTWMDKSRHSRNWADWIGVLPVKDFHAVCGGIDIPWATEEGKSLWMKVWAQ
jgi:hypothetical protein